MASQSALDFLAQVSAVALQRSEEVMEVPTHDNVVVGMFARCRSLLEATRLASGTASR